VTTHKGEKDLSRERAEEKGMKKRQSTCSAKFMRVKMFQAETFYAKQRIMSETVCLNGTFVPRCFRRFFKMIFISFAHLNYSTSESIAYND